jgi:hypothetical protein
MTFVGPVVAFGGDPALQDHVVRHYKTVGIPVIDMSACESLSQDVFGYKEIDRAARLRAELQALQPYAGPVAVTHTNDEDYITLTCIASHVRSYHVHHLGDRNDDLILHTPIFLTYINHNSFLLALDQLVMH